MQTVAQTLQFNKTLRNLAARARTRYAGEAARIDRGLVIALNGGVTLKADGVALVSSQRDDEVFYIVREGHCDCPDYAHAPAGRCKHRWATCLVKRATQQVAEEQAAQTYYAAYYVEADLWYQGTAWYQPGHGWTFQSADGSCTIADAETDNLVLGGNVAILEAQRAADGNLVHKVCYGK